MTWRRLIEGVVIAMHGEQISEHGGSLGIRDDGLLSSALARPRNQAAYGEPSVFDLAAAYAFGISLLFHSSSGDQFTPYASLIRETKIIKYTDFLTSMDNKRSCEIPRELSFFGGIDSKGWQIRIESVADYGVMCDRASIQLSDPYTCTARRNNAIKLNGNIAVNRRGCE